MLLCSRHQSVRQRHGFGLVAVAVVLLVVFATGSLNAGVLVAPTSVVLSDDKPVSRLTLMNTSDVEQAVTVGVDFGLPASDGFGNAHPSAADTAGNPRSAAGWIRAYPGSVVIPPHENLTIRVSARPPGALPDGEYWCRVIVRSQAADGAGTSGMQWGSGTRVDLVMQTAVVAKYRHGQVEARVELGAAEAVVADDQVRVQVDLKSTGNSSYVGVLECRLRDRSHREIASQRLNLTVYRAAQRTVVLALPEGESLPPYTVDLAVSSGGRTDIAANDIIAGNAISYSLTVE